MTEKLPSIVIVGRPNVGKSTLFNRLTGTRRSIVTNEPGITRDRIYGAVTWDGKPFEIVDTGGIVPASQAGIPGEILRQARKAIDAATLVVQIVDARTGPVPLDQELAELLRRAGKPPIIAANKVDTPQQAFLAAPFYEMSDNVYPISAEHGFGLDELLDGLTASFPKGEAPEALPEINVAIIGRPNVGKSTLLNRLVESERAIVSPEPGTTRDAVDTVTIRDGVAYRFLDTAGIRRKGKTELVAEKLSVIMAKRHLERADVALLVVDASFGVTAHDATIAGYAEESGRSVIIVMNKWDLAMDLARAKATTPPKRDPKPARERVISVREARSRSRGAARSRKGGGRQAAVADKFNRAVLTADSARRQSLQNRRLHRSGKPRAGLRKTRSREIEIPLLRADRLSLRQNRRARREIISADRQGSRSPPPQNFHRRTESLASRCRSRARHIPRQPQDENLLHHAGLILAAHIHPLHQSK